MSSKLRDLSSSDVDARLNGNDGLRLQMGPFVVAIRSPLAQVSTSVQQLYASHPIAHGDVFTDFAVSVRRPAGIRRYWHPQVTFGLDGQEPFNPLPGDQGFPLLEWGLNWCVYGMCHQYLILHSAVLERNGKALILPAPSGSGKSTLCAALLFHGWRLLSDELALICPVQQNFIPNPRPVSLKNASIEVLSNLVPGLAFGSRVSETTKGTVAHFAPPPLAVSQAKVRAVPGWVVLPKYSPGAQTSLKPVEKARMLMHLIENSFNYDLFAAEGFNLLTKVVDQSACFSFEYSKLNEAIELFAGLADDSARSH